MINTIYNLDCLDFLKKIDDESIDLVVVDPPYNLQRFDYGNRSDFQKKEQYEEWCKKWFFELKRVLKKEGSLYCWISKENLGFYQTELNKLMIYKNTIIWNFKGGFGNDKRNYVNRFEACLFYTKSDKYVFNKEKYFVPAGVQELANSIRNLKSVACYKNKSASERKKIFERIKKYGVLMTNIWNDIGHIVNKNKKTGHLNEKPVRLIERCIQMSSNENDIVLDCFGGGGSTFIASIKNKRKYIGCEIEKKWFDIINNRIEQYQNKLIVNK